MSETASLICVSHATALQRPSQYWHSPRWAVACSRELAQRGKFKVWRGRLMRAAESVRPAVLRNYRSNPIALEGIEAAAVIAYWKRINRSISLS